MDNTIGSPPCCVMVIVVAVIVIVMRRMIVVVVRMIYRSIQSIPLEVRLVVCDGDSSGGDGDSEEDG